MQALTRTTLVLAILAAAAGPAIAAVSQRAADQLHTILRAGIEPLDRQRVQTLFGVRTAEQCTHYQGMAESQLLSCRYLPVGRQNGPLHFVGYYATGSDAGHMRGGSAEWEVDARRLCLTEDDLRLAFGVPAGVPRYPAEDAVSLNGAQLVVKSYDFTLLRQRPADHYVAVVEIGGCVRKLRLSTYAPLPGEAIPAY